MIGLNIHDKEDERIDTFKKFIGMAETSLFSNDILDFYVKLMQSLEMSVVEILG